MEELTIGTVAQWAAIRSSAMRYYESIQILPTPRRINGHRCYDASMFDRLAIIKIAQYEFTSQIQSEGVKRWTRV